MKRKKIDSTKPPVCRKTEWWIKLQIVDDIAVLNIFQNGQLRARHCINTETHEHETCYPDGTW